MKVAYFCFGQGEARSLEEQFRKLKGRNDLVREKARMVEKIAEIKKEIEGICVLLQWNHKRRLATENSQHVQMLM